MLRTTSVITFEDGAEEVTLPARIRTIGGGRGDATIYNSSVTHSASVPRHPSLAEDLMVSDGVHNYRVIEVKNILGKYRLSLERI